MKRFVFAISGASGPIIGIRVLRENAQDLSGPSDYIFAIIFYYKRKRQG